MRTGFEVRKFLEMVELSAGPACRYLHSPFVLRLWAPPRYIKYRERLILQASRTTSRTNSDTGPCAFNSRAVACSLAGMEVSR